MPIDPSKMVVNPFIRDLRIEVTKITDAKKFILKEGVSVPCEFLIEKQPSTKVYHFTGVKERIYNLSPGAQRLYLWVMYNIEPNIDYIRINVPFYMTKNGIKSIKTYRAAVKEMIRYGFLCQSADYKDVYWINPEYIFNGNRIEMYPNNRFIKGELVRV